MLGLLLAAALSSTSAARPALSCEPGDGIPAEYCQLLRDGVAAVRASRYKEATTLLERALHVELFEVPNYELTGYLALAHCSSGDIATGLSLLADFDCMLSVDAGQLSCYAGPADTPERGHGLTDRCFETMCGEIYLGYYEDPTPGMLLRIQRLRRQAIAVRQICES